MDCKKTYLGVEFGSTRIKAVAIDENHSPVSSGDYTWASSFENGIWICAYRVISANCNFAGSARKITICRSAESNRYAHWDIFAE